MKDWTFRDVMTGPHYVERIPDEEPLFIAVPLKFIPLKRVHGRLVAGRALQRRLGGAA